MAPSLRQAPLVLRGSGDVVKPVHLAKGAHGSGDKKSTANIPSNALGKLDLVWHTWPVAQEADQVSIQVALPDHGSLSILDASSGTDAACIDSSRAFNFGHGQACIV